MGNEIVAKWDEERKVMTFTEEGEKIRDTFKRMMEEGRREGDAFSE